MNESQQSAGPAAIVVGGSLCGLACGMALARIGFTVALFERQRVFIGGSGMGVDLDLLGTVTGHEAHGSLPVVTGNRYSTSWRALYGWLLERAKRTPGLTMIDGAEVRHIGQDAGRAWLEVAAPGQAAERREADVLVGADGYRSVVRAAIDPAHPHAQYAGYVLWRGLLDERALPAGAVLPGNRVSVQYSGPYRLVAYAVPGVDGSLVPGRRQISWAWYDPRRDGLLKDTRAVEGTAVLHGLAKDEIPVEVQQELIDRATRCWSAPWGEVVATSIRLGHIFATPIAEYMPRRLVDGRLAMLGDAAHVVSPMTGAGYVTGLEDIGSLARCLSLASREQHAGDGDGIRAGLARFEQERIDAGRELVAGSRHWSRDFLARGRNAQPC